MFIKFTYNIPKNKSLGQLGQGNMNTIGNQPYEMGDNLSVIDLGFGRTAKAVAAGGFHTCVVLVNKNVLCWGSGMFGQLGSGNTINRGNETNQMGDNLPTLNFARPAGGNVPTISFAMVILLFAF